MLRSPGRRRAARRSGRFRWAAIECLVRALTLHNDPYTAVQSLDAIEGLLRRLTARHQDTSTVPGIGRVRAR